MLLGLNTILINTFILKLSYLKWYLIVFI